MKYVTGTYALNIPCRLETDGDWHAPALDWKNPRVRESSTSVFADWGIEVSPLPNFGSVSLPVANHLRACLDLLEEGYFSSVQGMREDYISNEAYTPIVLSKVLLLNEMPHWQQIDALLGREYGCDWLTFRKEHLGY